MQKMIFISSTLLMNSIIIDMGIVSSHLQKKTESDIDLLSNLENQSEEDVFLLEKLKEQLSKDKEISKKVKDSFVRLGKTLKSFYKSNDEDYNVEDFSDAMIMCKKSINVPFKELTGVIKSKSNFLLVELEKHNCDKVFHDTGKIWKKNYADKKRLESLKNNLIFLSEI